MSSSCVPSAHVGLKGRTEGTWGSARGFRLCTKPLTMKKLYFIGGVKGNGECEIFAVQNVFKVMNNKEKITKILTREEKRNLDSETRVKVKGMCNTSPEVAN